MSKEQFATSNYFYIKLLCSKLSVYAYFKSIKYNWKHFLICSLFLFLVPVPVLASDCLQYKLIPDVFVISSDWSMSVVQPLQEMDLLHGNVIATLSEDYELSAQTVRTDDGYCISLKGIDANVGYSDFLVQIDIRHLPNTCGYNATLAHENEHIRTYLAVIDDYNNYIKSSVSSAANSVMPVFISDADNMDAAINKLNSQLQSHPDLILMKQKIRAEEEIRNKTVDERDPGTRIKMCLDN